MLPTLWDRTSPTPLLRDSFLEGLRAFAKQPGSNPMALKGMQEAPFFRPFVARLRNNNEPVDAATAAALLTTNAGHGSAAAALHTLAPTMAQQCRGSAPAAKRAKAGEAAAETGEAYTRVLSAFGSAMDMWQALARDGAVPPKWFDTAVRNLGRELA